MSAAVPTLPPFEDDSWRPSRDFFGGPPPKAAPRFRYDSCDDTCTTDCGHCKGKGRPVDMTDPGNVPDAPWGGALPSRPETVQARFEARYIVDGESGCWNWTGSTDRHGYGRLSMWPRASALAHRVSYALHVGDIRRGMVIDHICHNPSCVNPEHLRQITHRQNIENRAGANANSTSGARGVSYWADRGVWRAGVSRLGRRHHVGYFATKEEAAEAVRLARLALFTHSDMDRRADR